MGAMGNYTHFNVYKNLHPGVIDAPQDASSLHRQARADSLPAPRSMDAVVAILSDTADKALPIFNNLTLSTFLVDGLTGDFHVWCCGISAKAGAPFVSWNL